MVVYRQFQVLSQSHKEGFAMYYVVELLAPLPCVKDLHPRCYTTRRERWVFTNKRAARLKYREVCKNNSRYGKYHEYGMCHGGLIMRVHEHNKYISEIVVTLRKIAYTPQKLHEVKLCEGYTK